MATRLRLPFLRTTHRSCSPLTPASPSVWRRLVLQHPAHFSALLAGAGSPHPQQLLAALVDVMLRKFDNVGGSTAGPLRRKLWAAALCALLPSADAALLQRLDEVMNVAADVLLELDDAAAGGGVRGDDEPASSDVGGGGSGSSGSAAARTSPAGFYLGELPAAGQGHAAASEAARRREMALRDWLYACDLRAYVLGQLGACRVAVGQAAFDAAWETVEPVIRQQVQQPRQRT